MITKNRIVAKALNAAHSRNAKFKVGDEVRVGNPHLADRGRYGRVVSAGVDGNPLLYDVDLGGGVQLFSESDLVVANTRPRNAKFKVGDKVKLIGVSPLREDFNSGIGKVTKVMERGNGAAYHVLFDGGREFPFVESQLVAANASRSTNAVVANALNAYIGSIRQPPRSGRFKKGDVVTLTSGDAQHRKWRIDEDYGDGYYRVVSTTGRIQSLSAPATIIKALNASRVARNERVDEATGRRDIEQSLRKMAELAARVSHAKATSKATHDDYSFAGYIDLAFPDKGAADNFNPYDVIYALRDTRSLVPKWAWGVGGFNYERKGNLWRIHIGRFAT